MQRAMIQASYIMLTFVITMIPHSGSCNRPYPFPQLCHKIKMAQRVWAVCTGNLWRELHFEMFTMKNAGFNSGETY